MIWARTEGGMYHNKQSKITEIIWPIGDTDGAGQLDYIPWVSLLTVLLWM